jgi:hypothetical protein
MDLLQIFYCGHRLGGIAIFIFMLKIIISLLLYKSRLIKLSKHLFIYFVGDRVYGNCVCGHNSIRE